MTQADMVLFKEYDWPGNIRELKNVMERAVLLSKKGRSDFTSLQPSLLRALPLNPGHEQSTGIDIGRDPFEEFTTLEELERRYIRRVFEKTGGKISGPEGAAALLGIKRSTLYNRMKRLGLR